MHGFIRNRRGEFTDVDIPGAVGNWGLTAINDRGQTAGFYVQPTERTPYVASGGITDGRSRRLDPPAGASAGRHRPRTSSRRA